MPFFGIRISGVTETKEEKRETLLKTGVQFIMELSP